MTDPTPREVHIELRAEVKRIDERFEASEKALKLAHSDARANIALLIAVISGILATVSILIPAFFHR